MSITNSDWFENLSHENRVIVNYLLKLFPNFQSNTVEEFEHLLEEFQYYGFESENIDYLEIERHELSRNPDAELAKRFLEQNYGGNPLLEEIYDVLNWEEVFDSLLSHRYEQFDFKNYRYYLKIE